MSHANSFVGKGDRFIFAGQIIAGCSTGVQNHASALASKAIRDVVRLPADLLEIENAFSLCRFSHFGRKSAPAEQTVMLFSIRSFP